MSRPDGWRWRRSSSNNIRVLYAGRAPDPTDQLLLACLYGATWRFESDWRWIIDAVTPARAGAVDWEHLTGTCGRCRCALPVRAALGFVASTLQTPVPDAVLQRLAELPVSHDEAQAFDLTSRRQGIVGSARRRWHDYQMVGAGRAEIPWGFVRYLGAIWGLGSCWLVPVGAAPRLAARLGGI